jgi:outer membrane protein TolC
MENSADLFSTWLIYKMYTQHKMNRIFLLITAISLIAMNGIAQQAKTDTLGNYKFFEGLTDSVEIKLVDLALRSPAYRASGEENILNELALKRAKASWLNLLSISTSYNDQSFTKATPTTTYVYPKYFFGVNIPLGIIFSQGNQTKTARESLKLSKIKQEEVARSIKGDILSKYKQYRNLDSLRVIQSEMLNDVLPMASKSEDDFKKGKITVDVYTATQKIKSEEQAKNLNLKLQQELLKLEIEIIIGVPLETVIRTTANK